MLLPPPEQCWNWSKSDIDSWCKYTYAYLNLARTNVHVGAYLARLWNLNRPEHVRILKYVGTRFKTGQQTFQMKLPQVEWINIIK
jgi:hypothetical protein